MSVENRFTKINIQQKNLMLMTVKLVSSLNPACYRPVSLIERSVQACSGCVTPKRLEAPQSSAGFREEGGGGRDWQLRDRWWQICLAANVHLSVYWRALSQWWFMHAVTPITSNIPRSDTSPYPSTAAKSGLVIAAAHASPVRNKNGIYLWEEKDPVLI